MHKVAKKVATNQGVANQTHYAQAICANSPLYLFPFYAAPYLPPKIYAASDDHHWF